jgi:hypothetical protein
VTVSIGVVRIAAVVYVLVSAAVAVFLIALASGASCSKLTAGRVPRGALDGETRVMVFLAAVSYVLLSGGVATSVGLTFPQYAAWMYPVLWIVIFHNGLATLRYGSDRSYWSLRVWAPANLVLTICVALVIIGLRSTGRH